MRDSILSSAGTMLMLVGMAVASSTHAQAYRVQVLESEPGRHAWVTGLTEAGDAVGRVGDAFAVWQAQPGFGRASGLTVLQEADTTVVRPGFTSHIDEAGYWYGSRNGAASVWSQAGEHERLELIKGRNSRVNDGSWPGLVVGYESNESFHAEPVAWVEGAAVRLTLPAWANSAVAEGVNNSGAIVGTARQISTRWEYTREAGVIWIADEAVELDSLAVGSNMRIVQACDVDERGRIAVNLEDNLGLWHAAILEPAGADLNGDGRTNSADFSAWLGYASQQDRRADLNGNGFVESADLNQLIAMLGSLSTQPESPAIDEEARATLLSHAFLIAGIYDTEIAHYGEGSEFHPIEPENSAYHNWLKSGNWNEYHPDFNPNCYGCSGDDPNNPHAPDGAPGWPGNDPKNPYKPNGGPGGPGSDGDPAGDGGDGGDGAPGDDPKLPGNGGPGGAGGDNTDDGPGGSGGSGGNGGTGDNDQSGGNGGTGGDGGNGGPNGGNSGDGGNGGNGGTGGNGASPIGPGAAGGPGGNGGDAGDAPNGDAGEGGNGGPGGAGGNGNSGAGGPGGDGGDAGAGGDAPNGNGGDGGDGGSGGSGGNGTTNKSGGNGGTGGDGGDGGNGDTNGGDGGTEGGGGTGGTGDPNGNDGSDGNGGSDGTP